MAPPRLLRWIMGTTIGVLVTVVPFLYYRWEYTHAKRLRVVVPDWLYRCGQLTVRGFDEAVRRYHIRTVLNLQDELPDPDVRQGYLNGRTEKESELCQRMGVHYYFLPPALIPRRQVPAQRPDTIDKFLAIMDNPANYPVLIHCRAGLHRTGVLTALYRMEYQHWTARQAITELKVNGFGYFPCSSANDYITQYILTYQPGLRRPVGDASR